MASAQLHAHQGPGKVQEERGADDPYDDEANHPRHPGRSSPLDIANYREGEHRKHCDPERWKAELQDPRRARRNVFLHASVYGAFVCDTLSDCTTARSCALRAGEFVSTTNCSPTPSRITVFGVSTYSVSPCAGRVSISVCDGAGRPSSVSAHVLVPNGRPM